MFIFCAATAPTGGVLFGSWIVDAMGGYCGSHQRIFTLKLCSTFGTDYCHGLFYYYIQAVTYIFVCDLCRMLGVRFCNNGSPCILVLSFCGVFVVAPIFWGLLLACCIGDSSKHSTL